MDSQLGLVVKVFVIAAVISIFIKYVCINLPIAPSNLNALIGISVPPLVMALLLGWRFSQTKQE